MAHMKCVCFLQASEESLEALALELREPKYSEYYLCQSVNLLLAIASNQPFCLTPLTDFTNILSKTVIELLAEVDEYEVVREVQVRTDWLNTYASRLTDRQEYFADYAPLLPSLFSLNHTPSPQKPLYGSSPNSWHPNALERSIQGITAVLLSLKKKPIIRYERMSGMAKKLAGEIQVRYLFSQRICVYPYLRYSIGCSPNPHCSTSD